MRSYQTKAVPVSGIIFTLLLLTIGSVAHAQTIKIATIAPEGSNWMESMRAGSAEISERSQGRVKIKFYGGGVQGNDNQVVRKMRIGQLHGGAFISTALAAFQKDSVLFGMPMLFTDIEEVQFVRQRMDHQLRELLENAGYVNFGFAGAGFAHLMSTEPIASLDDMRGLKVWIPDGDETSYNASRALGISPVTMPLTDVLTGLQTELIDTIMGPPAATIILQWNTGVSYITELPLAYVYGMLIVEKKYFDRIKAEDQLVVREVMERVYRGFDEQGNHDNQMAYQALLDDGMQAITPEQGQIESWRDIVRVANHELAGSGVVNVGLLNELECYLTALRSDDIEKDCSQ